MSGLEPLVALGLACNILQVVDAVKQSIAICRNILESGSVDPALDARVKDLTKICEELKTGQQAATGTSSSPEQKELVALAQSTIDTANELKAAIDKLSAGSSKGKLLAAVKGTMKTAWRKRTLERLEKNMLEGQKILETRLLVRVCNQNDALAVKQRKEFSTLDDTLQTFISNYSKGKTDMENLFRGAFASVETQITAEATKTRQELSAKIGELSVTIKEDRVQSHLTAESMQHRNAAVAKLLASLRYPTMNERRNNIAKSHTGTFEWVFRCNDGISSSEESSLSSMEPFSEHEFDTDDSEEQSSDYSTSSESGKEEHECDTECYTEFVNWLRSPDQPLFWIGGKPGSGKSTFMKFVLEDDRTQRYLNQGHSNTMIVSHFIWNAEHPSQRSLKGLLCSLLHQVVTGIDKAFDLLAGFNKISQLKLKENPGDWSIEELKAAVFFVTKQSPTPLCIMVDGLDEIDPADGPFTLLDVIEEICRISSVKMLVSSRPEPAFLSRFKDEPSLRVQDLTRCDISKYCKTRLSSFIGNGSCVLDNRTVSRFAYELSSRADGVFLWASLALKSLERGICNGDSETVLYKRLEGLPDDLNSLYKNMWDRLNEDQKLYREEAARILNMTLSCLDVSEYSESLGKDINYIWHDGTRLAITSPPWITVHLLALNMNITNRVIQGWDKVSDADIDTLYEKQAAFEKAITVRCAGLVEIQSVVRTRNLNNRNHEFSHPFLFTRVGFIHRSAKEFLCNTPLGLQILHHDTSTGQDRYCAVIKAHMARDILASRDKSYNGFRSDVRAAQAYTSLCFNPKLKLPVQERMRVLEYVEKYHMFIKCRDDTRELHLDQVGMLVMVGCRETVCFSLKEAGVNNRPVTDRYMNYLFMLTAHILLKSLWDGRGLADKFAKPLLSRMEKVNINARIPSVLLKRILTSSVIPYPHTREFYCNLPVFDMFLQGVIELWGPFNLARKAFDIAQYCHLFINLGPALDSRTVFMLCCNRRGGDKERVELALGFKRPFTSWADWDIMLESNTRYLLHILCQLLELSVGNDSRLCQQLSSLKLAVDQGPIDVKILGLRPEAGGRERTLVPQESAFRLVNMAQELTLDITEEGAVDYSAVQEYYSVPMVIPGYLELDHFLQAFTHETREITTTEFYDGLVTRGLIVSNRQVNPDTWPPPQHDDSPTISSEGALETVDTQPPQESGKT